MEHKNKKASFMERAFDTVRPLLLAPDQFRPFCDREQGLHFSNKYREGAIASGEGPAYRCSAGGSLYNACLVLRDMTGGRWNPFDHPLMRSLSVNPTSMQKGIGNEI